VRRRDWKLHLATPASADDAAAKKQKTGPLVAPQLYNLQTDVAEAHDVAATHPAVVAQLQALVATLAADLGLDGPAHGARALGRVQHPRLLLEFDRAAAPK